MDALTAYSSDEEGGGGEGEVQSTPSIDPTKASEVITKLKERFPLNSAPHVPVRVSSN
jgi:hypothetical protein